MYTDRNFKTKKELKLAVEAYNAAVAAHAAADKVAPFTVGAVLLSASPLPPIRPVYYYQPGPFGGNEPRDGTFCCEGPHYPEPHRWYATCTAKDGVIVKVK